MKDNQGQTCKQASIVATYDDNSKRFYRFMIDDGQGIKGSLLPPGPTNTGCGDHSHPDPSRKTGRG